MENQETPYLGHIYVGEPKRWPGWETRFEDGRRHPVMDEPTPPKRRKSSIMAEEAPMAGCESLR